MGSGESPVEIDARPGRSSTALPVLVTAGSAAVLWLVVGLVAFALGTGVRTSRYSAATDLVFPPTEPSDVWYQAQPWNVLLPVLAAVACGALVGLGVLVSVRARPASPVLVAASGWLSVVLAAAVTAGIRAVGAVLLSPGVTGYLWALRDVREPLTDAVWSAVVWGWVPALVLLVTARRRTVAPPSGTIRRALPIVLAAVALVAVVTLIVGQRVVAGPQDELPVEVPTPTPTRPYVAPVAPSASPAAPDACSSADVSLSLAGSGSALGHRGASIVLVNRGSAACTVDGYPDVAFADADGRQLDVPIEHGSSYLSDDAGPTRVQIEPGGTATAAVEWTAGTGDASAATDTVWIAPVAGQERQRVAGDGEVTEGTTVTIGAWATPTDGG